MRTMPIVTTSRFLAIPFLLMALEGSDCFSACRLNLPSIVRARICCGPQRSLKMEFRLEAGQYGGRSTAKLQFSPSSKVDTLEQTKQAPLHLEDGVWLPVDSFAEASTVVRVPKFLSAEEIESIHSAAQVVKTKVGSHIRKLPVDMNAIKAAHGPFPRPPWMTTYLQSLGYNRKLLPELMEKIKTKVIEVDAKTWGVLPDR
jgi:hypothetical protein